MTDEHKQDPIDRELGSLDRDDVIATQARVVTTLTSRWTGHQTTFIVQTFHEPDKGYTTLVQTVSRDGGERRLIPPAVQAAEMEDAQ